ncbi:MAG: hypothetical protein ABIY55_00755 [Kofleriaceae bacterium]
MSSRVAIRELPTHVLARHVRATPRGSLRATPTSAEQMTAVVVRWTIGPTVAQWSSHAGRELDDRSSALGV